MKLNDYEEVPAKYTGIIDRSSGSREWWVDGKRHRTDGPAYERANGHREWYVDGKRHRTEGPALEWANGDRSWWVKGKLIRKGTSILLVMYYEA